MLLNGPGQSLGDKASLSCTVDVTVLKARCTSSAVDVELLRNVANSLMNHPVRSDLGTKISSMSTWYRSGSPVLALVLMPTLLADRHLYTAAPTTFAKGALSVSDDYPGFSYHATAAGWDSHFKPSRQLQYFSGT